VDALCFTAARRIEDAFHMLRNFAYITKLWTSQPQNLVSVANYHHCHDNDHHREKICRLCIFIVVFPDFCTPLYMDTV
jgi:hypothetical protein